MLLKMEMERAHLMSLFDLEDQHFEPTCDPLSLCPCNRSQSFFFNLISCELLQCCLTLVAFILLLIFLPLILMKIRMTINSHQWHWYLRPLGQTFFFAIPFYFSNRKKVFFCFLDEKSPEISVLLSTGHQSNRSQGWEAKFGSSNFAIRRSYL